MNKLLSSPVVVVSGLVAAVLLYFSIRKDAKVKKLTNEEKTILNDVKKDAAVDPKLFDKCKNIAAECYKAFHGGTDFGFFKLDLDEDEEAAINAINGCTTAQMVQLTCEIYVKVYGPRTLKDEFDHYVNWTNGTLSKIVKQNLC